jgi:hypothetical protein
MMRPLLICGNWREVAKGIWRPTRVMICCGWYQIKWLKKPKVDGEEVTGFCNSEASIIGIKLGERNWMDVLMHEIEHGIESDSGVAYVMEKCHEMDADTREEMRIQITTPHRRMAYRSLGMSVE